jgi:hypothetical protein
LYEYVSLIESAAPRDGPKGPESTMELRSRLITLLQQRSTTPSNPSLQQPAPPRILLDVLLDLYMAASSKTS